MFVPRSERPPLNVNTRSAKRVYFKSQHCLLNRIWIIPINTSSLNKTYFSERILAKLGIEPAISRSQVLHATDSPKTDLATYIWTDCSLKGEGGYCNNRGRIYALVGYFRLFIVATGCPSERRPQKTVNCYGG